MPKYSCGRWVRMLAVLLDMLHNFLVNLPMILSSFMISGFEKGTV